MQDNSLLKDTEIQPSSDVSFNKTAPEASAKTRKRLGNTPDTKENTEMESKNAKSLPPENKKKFLSQRKKQDLVDLVMEYQYKYERLRGITDALKTQIGELIECHEKEKKDLVEVKNKLLENLYTLEGVKFSLDQKVEELSNNSEQQQKKHAELETQLEKLQEEIKKYQAQDKKEIEKLGNTIILEPLHTSMVLSSSTPHAVSRMKRRSMLNQTITTLAKSNDDKPREELLEDVVLVQQDILDFYSLLCGVSVWKESANEEEEEEIPESVLFNCKLQLLSPYNDLKFNMTLNFTTKEIEYRPVEEQYPENTPVFFKQTDNYNADEGYLFVKNFLDVI